MVLQVALSPWFNGIECLFDSVAIVVALLLTLYAYEVYKFSKIHEYKYFSLAFLAIAGSFFFKILTHVSFYNISVQNVVLGVARLALRTSQQIHIAFVFSVFAWHVLFLSGLLLYYAILDKARNTRQLFLSIYLAAVVSFLSIYQHVVFNITAAIILFFIVYILYVNSRRKQTKFTKLVIMAFLLILAAQVSFIFVSFYSNIYLLGEVLQLAGFVLLLLNFYFLMSIKK